MKTVTASQSRNNLGMVTENSETTIQNENEYLKEKIHALHRSSIPESPNDFKNTEKSVTKSPKLRKSTTKKTTQKKKNNTVSGNGKTHTNSGGEAQPGIEVISDNDASLMNDQHMITLKSDGGITIDTFTDLPSPGSNSRNTNENFSLRRGQVSDIVVITNKGPMKDRFQQRKPLIIAHPRVKSREEQKVLNVHRVTVSTSPIRLNFKDA